MDIRLNVKYPNGWIDVSLPYNEPVEGCSGDCAGCVFAGDCDEYQEDELFK